MHSLPLFLAVEDAEYFYSVIVPVFGLAGVLTFFRLLRDNEGSVRGGRLSPLAALLLTPVCVLGPLLFFIVIHSFTLLMWFCAALLLFAWVTKPARKAIHARNAERQVQGEAFFKDLHQYYDEHPVAQPQYMANAAWKPANPLPPISAAQRTLRRL